MWRPPRLSTLEELRLLKGFDGIIKDLWPELTMYWTGRGWERKQTNEGITTYRAGN